MHVHGTTELVPTANGHLPRFDGVPPCCRWCCSPSWRPEPVARYRAGRRPRDRSPGCSPAIDTSAVAAAHPDLIIATGDIDDATYSKLARSPRPSLGPQTPRTGWNWQNQLTWIGRSSASSPRPTSSSGPCAPYTMTSRTRIRASRQNRGSGDRLRRRRHRSTHPVDRHRLPGSLGLRYNPELGRLPPTPEPPDPAPTHPDQHRQHRRAGGHPHRLQGRRGGFAGLPNPLPPTPGAW